MKNIIFTIIYIFVSFIGFSQNLTQAIKGKIFDGSSQEPLPFATIVIIDSDPIIGTTTDIDGYYILEQVPIGRYDLEISYLSYESVIIPEVLVTSAKMVVLDIGLLDNVYSLEEVVIKPSVIKERPINRMATVSARMLSVEEANRYAGGFDDPARLASSFPGVASSVSNNAIIIRGNAPKSLQWKIEGVEIPNPNHFANLSSFGGGGLTALSSNVLANSDFYTGAFPAEYNNAFSGVFDIKMRTGNNSEFEHSFEIGAIGLDFSSEGPLSKNHSSSYLVNYRYSTLGLVAPLLPEDAQGTNYQDLSFKLKFPTQNAGLYSLWGIGLLDRSGTKVETNVSKHNYFQDIENQDVKQYMAAVGLNHRLLFNNSSYLNSTLAFSTNGIDLVTDRLDVLLQLQPENQIKNKSYNITLKTFLNKKFSPKHVNKTGVTIRGMGYDLLLLKADDQTNKLSSIVDQIGFSALVSAYSSSLFSLNKLKINIGLNSQLFTLNNNITIEPRLGISYRVNQKNKISLGYGLHSRLEPLNIFFAFTNNASSTQANKTLGFSKAHHLVFSYDWYITDKLHLKIEPYFQHLYNMPIIENTTSSLVNLQNDWFIDDAYINTGIGQNYGLDFTLEQYITNGFYYLVSASIFNSKYKANSDTWYNTRYNKNYLFNALIGKEIRIGKNNQNVLGINLKISAQGGDRYSKIDHTNSSIQQDVIFDETTPFTEQIKQSFVTHFTVNYEWYRKKTTHKLSLKVLNALNFKEFQGFRYNLKNSNVDEFREALLIPNISYKLSF
ncbi:MAG: carboxypeptidase-like regulatory domain-containing protein [Saprospiraceae bacterium]